MMKWQATDAYSHFGLPRFGSVEQLLHYMDVHEIERAVTVLGPLVPDLQSLARASAEHADRLRCVGIPFGETKAQRQEIIRLQLDAGAMAIRFEYREAMEDPEVLDIVGERGRWAYGIDACRDQRIAKLYLEWLARYPDARLAAPHFMYAGFQSNDAERAGGFITELMGHPRFYGILVRNLGMCGSIPPHDEYKAWINYVLEHCGAEHLMWGSEYPVLFWRNERAEAALELFRGFMDTCSEEQFRLIAGTNANEQFFSGEPPASRAIEIPGWVEEQFRRNRNVTFFPKGLELPVDDYERLLAAYMNSPAFSQGASMSDYLLKTWKSDM
ncbi:amidohydrolase family protein [Paenibacillus sepulcri]|uniref:Amidohydrolase n=1 Tax=Paenibacillus sepulcri TaxID=359917 RepID=A0ABS7CED7_9BACL|nr:amidohydrolase [Paenibacillus sepulcri]